MNAALRANFQRRSIRIPSQPNRFQCFASYSDKCGENKSAQFTDVSASGIRLVSRQMSDANVGDLLSIEFELTGYRDRIKSKALVVRKENDYVFALKFIDLNTDMEQAIENHLAYIRWASYTIPIATIGRWVHRHRHGIWLALIGLFAFSTLFTFVYLSSDEYMGKALRPWGKPYPQEWDLEYIRNFNQPSKK